MKSIFRKWGALAIVAALVLVASQPVQAGNQVPTASIVKTAPNRLLITLTATSMATGGADTAKAAAINMASYGIKPTINSSGVPVYNVKMWATGASGVDSLRAGLYWARSATGNMIEDRAIGTASANTNGKINVKLALQNGSNIIVPTTYTSTKFLQYLIVWYTNADAGTAGATVFYIQIEGAP